MSSEWLPPGFTPNIHTERGKIVSIFVTSIVQGFHRNRSLSPHTDRCYCIHPRSSGGLDCGAGRKREQMAGLSYRQKVES